MKRMQKQLITALLAALMLLTWSTVGIAADVTVDCTVDYAANRITLSGTVQNAGNLVSCFVEDPGSRPVFIGDIQVANNTFTVSFTVYQIVTGNYKITLKAEGMDTPIVHEVWVEKTASQYSFSCTAGQPLLLAAVVDNISNIHEKSFTITYNPALVTIDDLNAFTYKKDVFSTVPTGGVALPDSPIKITKLSPGTITFTYTREYSDQAFSGALNLIRFQANQSGTADFSIEMNNNN